MNSSIGQSSNDDPRAILDRVLGKLVAEFRNDPDLPKDIKESVTRTVLAFRRHLPVALAGDPKHKDSVIAAIQAALALGGEMVMRRRILGRAITLLNNMRTSKARAARRRDQIQQIIERHARALWAKTKRRELIANDERTAKRIVNAVIADIGTLQKIPKGWEVGGLSSPARQKQFIENIRKRVTRIPRSGR